VRAVIAILVAGTNRRDTDVDVAVDVDVAAVVVIMTMVMVVGMMQIVGNIVFSRKQSSGPGK